MAPRRTRTASAEEQPIAHEIAEGCVPALVLSLGGAPSTWHQIVGLPGYFHPELPTPVGGVGELVLEQALEHAADEGCPVEYVEIPDRRLEELRQLQLEQRWDATRAIRAQAPELDGAEVEQAHDELAAVRAAAADAEPPAETTTTDDAGEPAGEEA